MGRQRTFNEIDVLAAIEPSFWNQGYAATSLDDIVRASGLGKGSIYGTLGDKYTIFRKVFDRYCERVELATASALSGPDDEALQRLTAMLDRAASRVQGSEAQVACFLAKTTAELAESDAEVAARSRLAFGRIAANIAECITQAQTAGDIDPRANNEALSHHILTVLRGLEALSEAGVSTTVMTDAVQITVSMLSVGSRTADRTQNAGEAL